MPDTTQAVQPDGQAAALQSRADAEGTAAARSLGQAHRPIPKPDTVIAAALAQKVLFGWMQNRHQTLYPLVISLRNMNEAERLVLLAAMALARDAGDVAPEGRADAWLRAAGGTDEDVAALDAPGTAPGIDVVVQAARRAGQVPQAYAAVVGVLGRRSVANRRFQDFLAARLGLADDVARSLNRRYGA